jgi:hypothetical protein
VTSFYDYLDEDIALDTFQGYEDEPLPAMPPQEDATTITLPTHVWNLALDAMGTGVSLGKFDDTQKKAVHAAMETVRHRLAIKKK